MKIDVGDRRPATGYGQNIGHAAVSLWVKICGLTSADAVVAAVAAGANAVGFVFAPSKRRVSAAQAKSLSREVPKDVLRVAVMQHPAQALLDEVCEIFAPDVLQTDVEDLAVLRVPQGLQVTPVLRSGGPLPQHLPAQALFEGAVSGTGTRTDWAAAAQLAKGTQLILAGGLNAANIGEAIRRVRPFGVDVSSGVEREPGIKDLDKIHEFIRAARRADEESSCNSK